MDGSAPHPGPHDLDALIARVDLYLDTVVPALECAGSELGGAVAAVRSVAAQTESADAAGADPYGLELAARFQGEGTDPLDLLVRAVHSADELATSLTNLRTVLFMVRTAENDPAARRALYALIHQLDGHGPN